MNGVKAVLLAVGLVVGVLYVVIADSIQTNEAIWLFTRAYGLISYFLLFLLVVSGELKMLGFSRHFKYHCSIAILTCYVVFLHFISAVYDKFKWGKGLSFIDYLGFNFSDKWLFYLSLGTLSFYLLLLIGLTSSGRVIRKLGFDDWKLLHIASYAVMVVVFVHSIMLGTDVKTSDLRVIVFPLIVFSFIFAVALLAVRLTRRLYSDKIELALAFILVFIVASAVTILWNNSRAANESINLLSLERFDLLYEVDYINSQNEEFNLTVKTLNEEIAFSVQKSKELSLQIKEVNSSIAKLLEEKNRSKTTQTTTSMVASTTEPVVSSALTTLFLETTTFMELPEETFYYPKEDDDWEEDDYAEEEDD